MRLSSCWREWLPPSIGLLLPLESCSSMPLFSSESNTTLGALGGSYLRLIYAGRAHRESAGAQKRDRECDREKRRTLIQMPDATLRARATADQSATVLSTRGRPTRRSERDAPEDAGPADERHARKVAKDAGVEQDRQELADRHDERRREGSLCITTTPCHVSGEPLRGAQARKTRRSGDARTTRSC